ncbi:hypothetical protein BDZ97DRAFT_1921547 [Flammula alnicola]|nr:hypothetical protein BDZ97DRAFT_1921547 [Flammula alnicola]
MSSEEVRLPYQLLERKTSVVCFVKSEVAPTAIEAFEDRFAKGRDCWNTWTIHPTKSYNDSECLRESVLDLLDLCREKFSEPNNVFYPYFLVILDERTVRDGSVLLVQRDPMFPGTWELRISPGSLAVFLTISSIGHTTIEDVIANEGYDDESRKDMYIYDVAFDHGDDLRMKNARIPVSEFQRSNEADGVSTLRLSASKTEAYGLPAVDIQVQWFGEPLNAILILSATLEDNPNERHVVGETRTQDAPV